MNSRRFFKFYAPPLSESMPDSAKFLYCLIVHFNADGGRSEVIKNKHFAEVLGWPLRKVERWLSWLKENDFIEVEPVYRGGGKRPKGKIINTKYNTVNSDGVSSFNTVSSDGVNTVSSDGVKPSFNTVSSDGALKVVDTIIVDQNIVEPPKPPRGRESFIFKISEKTRGRAGSVPVEKLLEPYELNENQLKKIYSARISYTRLAKANTKCKTIGLGNLDNPGAKFMALLFPKNLA